MSTYIQQILDYLNDASDQDIEPATYTAGDLDDETVERVRDAAGEHGDLALVRACERWMYGPAEEKPIVITQINISEGDDVFGPNVESEEQEDALVEAYMDHAGAALDAMGHPYSLEIARNTSGLPVSINIYAEGDVEDGESAEVLTMDDDPRTADVREDIQQILGEAFLHAWDVVSITAE